MSNTQNNVHDAASSMALQEVKLIDTLLRVVKVPDVVAQLIAAKGEVSRISSALDLADEDSLSRWRSLSLGYTESLGLPALRSEIASLYQKVTADTILTLAPEEGIFIIMQTKISMSESSIMYWIY